MEHKWSQLELQINQQLMSVFKIVLLRGINDGWVDGWIDGWIGWQMVHSDMWGKNILDDPDLTPDFPAFKKN